MRPEKQREIAQRLMHRLEAFPSFRPERKPHMAEEYTAAIMRMLTEFGSEITVDAVTKAVDQGGPFPPTPAQIRELIPLLEAKQESVDEVFQVIDERKFFKCEHGWFIGTPCQECPASQVLTREQMWP